MRLATNPVSTFFGNRLLGKLITELHLKFGTIKAALPRKAGNIEFTLFFRSLLADEGRRSKNKADFINMLQLLLQFLIGINRKASGGDRDLATLANGLLQIITDGCRDVIDHFHVYTSHAFCLE